MLYFSPETLSPSVLCLCALKISFVALPLLLITKNSIPQVTDSCLLFACPKSWLESSRVGEGIQPPWSLSLKTGVSLPCLLLWPSSSPRDHSCHRLPCSHGSGNIHFPSAPWLQGRSSMSELMSPYHILTFSIWKSFSKLSLLNIPLDLTGKCPFLSWCDPPSSKQKFSKINGQISIGYPTRTCYCKWTSEWNTAFTVYKQPQKLVQSTQITLWLFCSA